MTWKTHIPFVALCAYPPRAGNAVRPLVDGIPAYRRIAEAIMAARPSIWLTAAFVAPDFQMPGGSGALFDVLDRAVERGLDVRVIFWRPNQESIGYGRTSQAHRTSAACSRRGVHGSASDGTARLDLTVSIKRAG